MATQVGQLKYSIGFDVKKQDLNNLKKQLQQLQKLSLSNLMKINDVDRSRAVQIFDEIRDQAENVEKALNQAYNVKLKTTNVQAFNKSLHDSRTSLQQVYNTFKQGGITGENAFRSLITQVTTSNIKLKETHSIIDKIATTLGNSIKWNVASSAINAVTRSVQQAWGYVKNLDTSLNDIRIVTGKSADEMARFAQQATETSKVLGKTTVDYTKASLIYAQQGLSDKEIAARAAITLKAANVTGQSTDEVSEQLTSVWNGYKVTAEQAQLYIDRLAAVAANTASDLEQLSTGMSKVAAAAAAMGVGQDQLAAQLSTIISVTRQAPESVGTALRTVYARISDIKAGIDEDGVTLGNYSGKMAQLGFNVLDVNGKLRDMGTVMEEIGGKWASLTREQQVSLAQTMAGQRQYSNLIALFDNFTEYNRALNIAQNATGTLQKQQNVYMQSTRAHLNQLKTATEDLYDSLINTDSIKPLIDGLTTVVSLAAKFVDSLGGGGNLLITLGGIAANVFSKQMTKGVETFVHNIRLAKENTKDLQNRISMLRNAANYEGMSDEDKAMFNKNADSLKAVVPTASPEQYAELVDHMKGLTAAYNDLNNTKKEVEQTDKVFIKLQKQRAKSDEDIINLEEANEEQLNKIHERASESIKTEEKNNQKLVDSIKDTSYQLQIQQTRRQKINEELKSHNLTQKEAKQLRREYNQRLAESNDLIDKQIVSLKEFKNTDFSGEGFKKYQTQIDNLIGTLEKLKDKGLDTTEFAPKVQQITELLESIPGKSEEQIEALFKKINQLKEELNVKTGNLKNQDQGYNSFLKGFADQKKIQAIGKMVGVTVQLGTAINQVGNAGKAFRSGQIAQGFMSVASGVGSMIMAITSATQAMKVFDLTTKQIIATNVFLALAAAAASAIAITVNAIKAFDEAKIKLANESIEEENKRQEQIASNKQLYKSIEDLNEKYKQGQITRLQLRSQIEDLIDQYGLEGQAIRNLAGDYDALHNSIKQQNISNLEQGIRSANKEKSAAEDLIMTTAHQGKGWRTSGGNYRLGMLGGGNEDERKVISYFEKAGYHIDSNVGFGGHYSVKYDVKSIVELYDKINEAINQINQDENISTAQRANSELYQKNLAWLNKMSDSVEKYKTALKDAQKYQNELNILTSTNINLDNIRTVNQYLEQRNKIIKELKARNTQYNDEQAANVADAYLRENHRQLFIQFDQTSKYITKIQDQINDGIDEQTDAIANLLNTMDEQHLAWFMDHVDLKNIKTWDELKKRIEEISDIDLSNIDFLTNMQDITLAKQGASESYAFLQSLEDQVKSGKTIGSKELKELTERFPQLQIQKYFTMMANGQYKMTEDAKTFYNAIDSLKISKFYDVINDINGAIERNQKVASGQFDFDKLNKNAYDTYAPQGNRAQKLITNYSFNDSLVNQQINALKQLRSYDSNFVSDLQQKQKTFNRLGYSYADKEAKKQIADYVKNAIEEQVKVDIDTDQLNNQLKQVQQQIHDALFPTDSDIDKSILSEMTQLIQALSNESDELDDKLDEDSRAAEDVAEAILRFNNAINDVIKNYDTWLDVLDDEHSSLQQIAQILQPLRDAYADLLGMHGDALSKEFLQSAQNLKLMKQAADGNLQSYEQLRAFAAQDIVSHIKFDTTTAENEFLDAYDEILSWIEDNNFDLKFDIGAQLTGKEALMNSLTDLINATQMTASQASDLLHSAFGIDAQVINESKPVEQEQVFTGMTTNVDINKLNTKNPLVGNNGEVIFPEITYEPKQTRIKNTQMVQGTGLKIINARKTSGGNIKWKNSSQGAGAAGTTRRTTQQNKTKVHTKDLTPAQKDDRDIYHDINIQLAEVNRQLNRTQKQQSKLYGKDLINNLNKQTQILEQHKNKLKEKNALQKLDLEQKQKQLAALGVLFDQYGHIANYLDILGVKQGNINGLIAQRNSLVGQYNSQINEDTRKILDDQISVLDKQIKTVETDYKDLETAIKNYDNLRTQIEDLIDQIQEQTQKQIQIRINKAQMKVQIAIDMGDFEREWNEFERKIRNGDNLFNDSEFDTLFKDRGKDLQDIMSYFDVLGESSLVRLTNGINDILAEQSIQEILNWDGINKLDQSVYSDHVKQALDDLKSYGSQIMGQMENIQQLKNNIDQAYFDTIDYIDSEFDRQIEQYEFVNQRLQHNIDLVQLVYGEKAYDSMDAYYTQLLANDNKELDSLKQQAAYYKQMWDNAIGEQDARKFEELWRDTISQLDSKLAESIKTAENQYINAINKIYDELDKRLTSGKGLEYVQMEWQLINKNADEYLDTINSAFALRDLESKFQKAINDTKNVKNQKTLTDLMNQQLDHLRTKDKLTQYDVERAEKLLGIEQARMALEDTRNAKTSLRLKRDSQGNYSYVYTASEKEVDDAEDKLAKLQNDLYNFDKQAYKDNLDDMFSAYKEYLSKQQEILIKYKDDEEARERALTLLREQYGEYINGKTKENIQIRTNLANSAAEDYITLYNQNSLNFKQSLDADYQNFEQLTQSMKEELASEFVPNWQNSVQQMTNTFIGQGGFVPACKAAWQEVDIKTAEYQTIVHTLADSAGTDLGHLKAGIDEVTSAYSELITKNDELITKMDAQMTKIQGLREQLQLLENKYKDIWQAADTAAQKAKNAWLAWQKYTEDALNTPTPQDTAVYNPPTALPTSLSDKTLFNNESNNQLDQPDQQKMIIGTTLQQKTTQPPSSSLINGLASAISSGWWGGYLPNTPEGQKSIRQLMQAYLPKSLKEGYTTGEILYWVYDALDKYGYEYYNNKNTNLLDYIKYSLPYLQAADKGGAPQTQQELKKFVKQLLKQRNGSLKFDTGGYTGEWGSQGRLAMLHQKQLVLNATDTKNILNSVAIIRDMVTGLSGNIFSRLNGLNGGYSRSITSQIGGQVDQNVTISASFPNVNSKKEIEDAFTELVNLAAQRAMKR